MIVSALVSAAVACSGTAIAGEGKVVVVRVPDKQGSGHTVQACWRPTGRRRLIGDHWTVPGRGYSRVKFVRVSGRFAAAETTWHEEPFRELAGEHTVRIVVVDVKSGKRRTINGDVHNRMSVSRRGIVRWNERVGGRITSRTSSW